VISLINDKPKLFMLFGYSKIKEEREEFVFRLNNIWNCFKNENELIENIDIFIIFRGESLDQAGELLNEEIFQVRTIYLMNNNSDTNIPFALDSIDEDTETQLLFILLAFDNNVKYVGNLLDTDIKESLRNMINRQAFITLRDCNVPMNKDERYF
jgi:hypothetical protein